MIEYYDEYNYKKEKLFSELNARICLHEMDHLKGKLIIDYKDKDVIKKETI